VTRVAGAAGADNVRHVPRVLSHRPAEDGGGGAAQARAACVARLTGAAATPDAHGHVRVTWALPDPPPLVSLIVPTRDGRDLLEPCIEGLLQRTDYPALEVLIADNDSRERRTLAYLEAVARDRRVRVVPCPGAFNFAAINNRVAAMARGDVLGFINNDIEVMAPDWLREMTRHALRPDAGAVGAKLIYPSGLVQHAGVIVGLGGLAGHGHRFYPAAHPGYMRRLQCTQVFSAVTAACLVMRRDVFREVGGFDAAAFPVAYNDVDLCLRLGARGLRTVWTPYAVLRHKETATRERDYAPARLAQYRRESAAFQERWAHVIAHDPHYHPLLTREDERFLP
jgi:GT2 family glycosyltransferase